MLDQFSQLLLALQQGASHYQIDQFLPWVFGLLTQVVPADAGFFAAGAERGGLPTLHHLYAHRLPVQEMSAAWLQHQNVNSLPYLLVANTGTALNFRYEDLKGTAYHERFLTRFQVNQLLSIYLCDPRTYLYNVISLYRGDPTRPFSDLDRAFFQAAAPHVVEAFRLNHLSHLACCSHALLKDSAVVDRLGHLHLARPGFVEHLTEEWPDWTGPALPDAVVAAIAEHGRYKAKRILLRGNPATDSQLSIFVARPLSSFDDLTQRESQIATHYAHGLSFKEIAAALTLSPATVRNNLSAIYRKLSISDKSELTALVLKNEA